MRYLVILILAAMLAGCVGKSAPMPLNAEEKFSKGDTEYLLSVSSEPEELRAGEPFTMKIEVKDLKTSKPAMHLTYELQILDKAGKNVFTDAVHAMEGAPYVREMTLSTGDYTLKLVITHGMGEKIMTLHETGLKFRVKG